MTLKPTRNSYGYRELLVYQKADSIQSLCVSLTSHFPHSKTLVALADQMNRSARSTKQNIVEGWKRNSTKEYYEFLGYAVASNAELEEDATDICKGHYPELQNVKEIIGEKGIKGERGIKGESGLLKGKEMDIKEIETLPFYPLNPLLPLIVRFKLQAKELNFLLEKLQKSLVTKMEEGHTLPTSERIKRYEDRENDFDRWLEKERKRFDK